MHTAAKISLRSTSASFAPGASETPALQQCDALVDATAQAKVAHVIALTALVKGIPTEVVLELGARDLPWERVGPS
jgi:hypothetical protein